MVQACHMLPHSWAVHWHLTPGMDRGCPDPFHTVSQREHESALCVRVLDQCRLHLLFTVPHGALAHQPSHVEETTHHPASC